MLGFDGLVASHNHGLNDIFGRAAARKVVDRSGETLHNWACSHSAGEALHEFVGDVSGLEVTSTLARPAISLPGALLAPTDGTRAASA